MRLAELANKVKKPNAKQIYQEFEMERTITLADWSRTGPSCYTATQVTQLLSCSSALLDISEAPCIQSYQIVPTNFQEQFKMHITLAQHTQVRYRSSHYQARHLKVPKKTKLEVCILEPIFTRLFSKHSAQNTEKNDMLRNAASSYDLAHCIHNCDDGISQRAIEVFYQKWGGSWRLRLTYYLAILQNVSEKTSDSRTNYSRALLGTQNNNLSFLFNIIPSITITNKLKEKRKGGKTKTTSMDWMFFIGSRG